MKVCSKCEVEKELSEYSNRKVSKDGKNSKCKKCEKDYREDNKEKIKESQRKHREDNKEKLLESHRKYNKENRDLINKKNRIYSEDNKEKIKESHKKYNKENRDLINRRQQKYREDNKGVLKEKEKKYFQENKNIISKKRQKYKEDNKEKIKESDKKYREDNKDKINKYFRDRRKQDPLFKLSTRLRSLIYISIKKCGWVKNTKTQEILGCSFEVIKKHLNDKPYSFKFGDKDLDLDHIVPLSTATTEEEVLKLNHYSNFQLLPSEYNQWIKRDKPWDREDFENWLGENWSWEQ